MKSRHILVVEDDANLRELIANYYGMISLIDHNVGRILLELEQLGLRDQTLVVYSTDHGDWLGDHGLILKGPMAYEGLLRVGLIFMLINIVGVEFLINFGGLGQLINELAERYDLPGTYGAILFVILASVLFFVVLERAERWLLPRTV